MFAGRSGPEDLSVCVATACRRRDLQSPTGVGIGASLLRLSSAAHSAAARRGRGEPKEAVPALQNGFVESFNGRLRDECLNEHLFRSYGHAREIIDGWRYYYNNHRPHTSLDGLTPREFTAQSKQDHNQNRSYSRVGE